MGVAGWSGLEPWPFVECVVCVCVRLCVCVCVCVWLAGRSAATVITFLHTPVGDVGVAGWSGLVPLPFVGCVVCVCVFVRVCVCV